MNSIDRADLEFERRFTSGELLPAEFDHRAHLRLAYLHIARSGLVCAGSTFRAALRQFLSQHQIDPAKFHETLTDSWLQVVGYFMHCAGDTAGSEDFVDKSNKLLDPGIMLTHFSRELLGSEAARTQAVAPDLQPIPRGENACARDSSPSRLA